MRTSNFQADMYGYGFSGQVHWDLGLAALTSITAPRAGTGIPPMMATRRRLAGHHPRRTSQSPATVQPEFRIASTGENVVDYVAGLYYFNQTIERLRRDRLWPGGAQLVPADSARRAWQRAALNGFIA